MNKIILSVCMAFMYMYLKKEYYFIVKCLTSDVTK